MSDLLEHVKRHCKIHQIELQIANTSVIQYPGHSSCVSGFFVVKNNNPILGIALGAKSSDEILLHEFNHSIQWIENDRSWKQNYLTSSEIKKFSMQQNAEALDIINLWTDKSIELTSFELTDFINRAISVELDCEKRTVKWAFLYLKDFNSSFYTQKANAYLRYYKFVELNRRWNLKTAPYDDKATIASQLSTFDQDYLSPLSIDEINTYNDLYARDEVVYNTYLNENKDT